MPNDARALAFTPDGRSLVTAGGPLSVLGLGAERPVRTLKGPTGLDSIDRRLSRRFNDRHRGRRRNRRRSGTLRRACASPLSAGTHRRSGASSSPPTARPWPAAGAIAPFDSGTSARRTQRATLTGAKGMISALAFASRRQGARLVSRRRPDRFALGRVPGPPCRDTHLARPGTGRGGRLPGVRA